MSVSSKTWSIAFNSLLFNSSDTAFYFDRFGFCPSQLEALPHPELGLVVVIPSYDEPNLLEALNSLLLCDQPLCAVEVIVVINSGADAAEQVKDRNKESFRLVSDWIPAHTSDRLAFHVLHLPDLPPKKAGVGLARKIGMDEALRRFDRVNRPDGVIGCFDADCTCDPNYLQEIERYFRENSKSPGCSIYFEHPLEGPESAQVYEAVTLYELHLRYYVEALRYARFPYAFHTVGSSMAVRANAYQKQGGMNKRQAGEDFYFLHKIIPLGAFGEINTTRVLASPRPSERVPFGTGRAVREYLASAKYGSYPLEAFEDLRLLFELVPKLYEGDSALEKLPAVIKTFCEQQKISEVLRGIRKHTASAKAFEKRFFHWFDGFLAMKYIHFARDSAYGSADIVEVANRLQKKLRGDSFVSTITPRELLTYFRRIQRTG